MEQKENKSSFGQICKDSFTKTNEWFKKTANSFTNWAKNLKPSYWINISLWILTLIFLIVIIVVSALQGDETIGYLGGSKESYSNIIAALVLVFALILSSAIIHIVVVKMLERKKGVNNVSNA